MSCRQTIRPRLRWLLWWWVAVLAQPAWAGQFEDTLAQRMLACTGCHGENGRAVGDVYFPRIAGKPAGYLFNQLRNFREGRRVYPLMTGMVDFLDDAYLREIAQHFSALDLPYERVPVARLAPAQRALAESLVLRGDPTRKLVPCTSCHGQALTGAKPNVPGLLGLPRDYINAQLGAWKTGQRRAEAPDCMAHLAREMRVDEVSAVSAWLAEQPLPSDPRATVPARATEARPACGSAPELGAGTR